MENKTTVIDFSEVVNTAHKTGLYFAALLQVLRLVEKEDWNGLKEYVLSHDYPTSGYRHG